VTHSLGIRLEDKNIWERRVPLTPAAVGELAAQSDIEVRVQASPARIFPDAAYLEQGAVVVADPFDADVVVAVKEIPTAMLRADGTYVYFSHTIKGQPYNMDMLRRLMELRCNLLDYERVVDAEGRRLIFFSWFAGAAGAIDTLQAAGERYAHRGIANPFEQVGMTYSYGGLDKAEVALRGIGDRIRSQGLPQAMRPFVIGVTGYGNVSQGAQHVLDWLPIQDITPEELPALTAMADPPGDRIFRVVFREQHMVEPVEAGAPFELMEYFQHPERYRTIFERWVPHLDLMINAIYWTEASPRLISNEQLRGWFEADGEIRLQVVGDISCDILGSVECLVKATEPDTPHFVYDPITGVVTDGTAGRGLCMMAVDNLPCELPAEASRAFSDALAPFVAPLVRADFSQSFEQLALPAPIKAALILHNGELTPAFRYMAEFV
jgi:saccharopine dehydrogenase (NAD+, L-lysine forming)